METDLAGDQDLSARAARGVRIDSLSCCWYSWWRGRLLGGGPTPGSVAVTGFIRVGLPVFAAVLVALSGVLSLVTIISIYREGGILKRLRATPLRPQTILTAHVLVKLALTVAQPGLVGAGGQTILPDQCRRSHIRICDGAADQHLEHPVDRISDREHCAHGAVRATDRRGHPVSHAGPVRVVRTAPIAATCPTRRGARAAADLCSVPAPGNLERRGVVGAHCATSRRWWSYLRFARHSRRRCFAGNSEGTEPRELPRPLPTNLLEMAACALTKEDELHWLALRLVPGLGARKAGQLVAQFRSPQAIFRASRQDLEAGGPRRQPGPNHRQRVHLRRRRRSAAENARNRRAAGPALERRVSGPAARKFSIRRWCCSRAAGWTCCESVMLGVVGTRRPTPYGIAACERAGHRSGAGRAHHRQRHGARHRYGGASQHARSRRRHDGGVRLRRRPGLSG